MPGRTAILYRMKLPDHECPYGLLAKRMIEDSSFELDDRLLTSREEVDAFKAKHHVATTPLVFIDDEPVGGTEDLAAYLEKVEG